MQGPELKVSELLTERNTGSKILKVDPATLIGEPIRPYSDDELDELVQEIKTVGLIRPIIVVQHDEQYEVVTGFRRWKAALKAGLSEIDIVVETPIDQLAIARLRVYDNAMKQSGDIVGAVLSLLAMHLNQPEPTVFTQLNDIEQLFVMLTHEELNTEEQLHQRMLRQYYTGFKRQLNKQAKKQTKYLLDDSLDGLQIGFKFAGQWYAVHSNPPQHLKNVRKAWRIQLAEVLDPDQL